MDPAVPDVLTVVVFSKDRPLQLHATLASLRETCADPARLRVRVITCASTERTAERYRQVAQELPFAELVPEEGFRATLLAATCGARWLAFVVDDCLFVRGWRVEDALSALRHIPLALGVSLRLGCNTTRCYTLDRSQAVPGAMEAGPWLAYAWPDAACDFGYPLELSSSVYRGDDLRPLLEELTYRNPNELEAALAACAPRFREERPVLLMARASLAFCAPLNVVQRTFRNRAGMRPEYGVEALERAFDRGVRVDVGALREFTPDACHQEIELPLVGGGRLAVPPPAAGAATPAVSVVIPCYRQAEYLPMAVSSVALQTFRDLEVVVVNDGSPDDTSRVVQRLAGKLPDLRLRLLEQPNAGLANARNSGIRAARGRYLLPLDADDALEPAFLERTVEVLEARPEVAVVATDVGVFGVRSGTWRTGGPFDLAHLLEQDGLAYCSLFRREVWERTGGYRASMSAGYEDWDFWVGAAAAGFAAAHVALPLFLYREKSSSMLTEARLRHRSLRARLLLNHREVVSREACEEAERILAEAPLPPAKPDTRAREVSLAGARRSGRRAGRTRAGIAGP